MLSLAINAAPLRNNDPVHVEKVEIAIPDLKAFVRSLDADGQKDLVVAIVDAMAVSDIVDAIEDDAAPLVNEAAQLTDRGTALLDVMVERAEKLGRLPDDYEPDWVASFSSDARRLQELIAARETAAALDLLAEMAGSDGDLLSTSAALMVGGFRQETLL